MDADAEDVYVMGLHHFHRARTPHDGKKALDHFTRAAIFGHAPQAEGDINNSDFDFCDTPEGVLGIYAGNGNQVSNPYFNAAAIARNTTSAAWLASFFPANAHAAKRPRRSARAPPRARARPTPAAARSERWRTR